MRLRLLMLMLTLFSGLGHATTPANAQIANQAVVTYVDQEGLARSATTNEVVITVRQVYSATIRSDAQLTGAPSQPVVFLHTLANTGNGPDRYAISVANDATYAGGDDGNFVSIKVFQDSNRNGQVDVGEPQVTTAGGAAGDVALAAGASVQLIVVAKVPNTLPATPGAVLKYDLTLTAAAYQGGTVTVANSVADSGGNLDGLAGTNEDRVTLSLDAVLQVTKSATYDDKGTPSADDDTIAYKVVISNPGQERALDIVVTDLLPVEVTYLSGATSSQASAWTFPAAGDDGLNGSEGVVPVYAAGTRTFTGEIDYLPTGASADFSYVVSVNAGLADGTQIKNTASADGELNLNTASDEPAVLSNETLNVISIAASYGVNITDTGESAGGPGSANDGKDDDGFTDIQYVDLVGDGSTVLFTNKITNSGSARDSFNLGLDSSDFPTGTVFRYFQADGITPLLDSNRDGIVDSGPLNAAATRTIVVKAVLPPGFGGGGAYNAVVRATSNSDPAATPVFNTVGERLGGISTTRVDLANANPVAGLNDGAAVTPVDAHPVSSLITTLNGGPGQTLVFPLFLANEGASVDSYLPSAWANAAATTALPVGWQVEFRDLAGNTLSSTRTVQPNAVLAFTAHVTIPTENAVAGTQLIFFKVRSQHSLASDTKQDAVSVSLPEAISLSPDQSGIVAVCGSIDYVHSLTNGGLQDENVVVEIVSQNALSAALLLPTSNDGAEFTDYKSLPLLTPGQSVAVFKPATGSFALKTLVTDGAGGVAIPLLPGERTEIRARVFAPCDTNVGIVDRLILNARVLQGTVSSSVTNVSTVTPVSVYLFKQGALDANCDNSPGAFSTEVVSAAPGQCVIWQITATNTGNAAVCNVHVYDAAPNHTNLNLQAGVLPGVHQQPAPGTGSCTVTGTGSDLDCTVGNDFDIDSDGSDESFCLLAGQKAVVRFRVAVQ